MLDQQWDVIISTYKIQGYKLDLQHMGRDLMGKVAAKLFLISLIYVSLDIENTIVYPKICQLNAT
jgi:hypothetical protein